MISICIIIISIVLAITIPVFLPPIIEFINRVWNTDDKKERGRVANLNQSQKYIGKELVVHWDDNATHTTSFGVITGWVPYKPDYIEPNEIEAKKQFKTEQLPPKLEFLYYTPFAGGFFAKLFRGDENVLFDPKNIKRITNEKVIIRAVSIEPYKSGHDLLTWHDTPVQAVATALKYTQEQTLRSSELMNMKKLLNTALNLNPRLGAELRQKGPSILTPAPKKETPTQ